MFDLDKEELELYYPDDEIRKEFFELIMLKNESFWIDPDEDRAKLLNTERKANYSKGFEEGFDEKTINVIKNAINQSISIETIATLVNLSIDEVKNIIKEHNLDKLSE